MTEDQIQRELGRIAVSEIGKKNVVSATVRAGVDFQDEEVLEILVTLKPEAPTVSGEAYGNILVRAYDFLNEHKDGRRPSLAVERATVASATTER